MITFRELVEKLQGEQNEEVLQATERMIAKSEFAKNQRKKWMSERQRQIDVLDDMLEDYQKLFDKNKFRTTGDVVYFFTERHVEAGKILRQTTLPVTSEEF